ncbi:MAG: hypothetical protein ACEQSR_04770 [Candidatus Methylacidiphilales bacterium]
MQPINPSQLLSKHLFWDINPEILDWEINKKTIIGRVLERGTLEEWNCIVKIYSLETITDILKNFRDLNPIDLNFIATISNTPKENFRCFNTKLLTNQHWIY